MLDRHREPTVLPCDYIGRAASFTRLKYLMDPLSIGMTAAGIIQLCSQISKAVVTILADDRDDSFLSLKAEIDVLHRVSKSLLSRMNGRQVGTALWHAAGQSVMECRQTLESLNSMLHRRNRNSFLRNLLEAEIEARKICALTQQITRHHQTLALSLTVYHLFEYKQLTESRSHNLFASEANNDSIHARLDEITAKLSSLAIHDFALSDTSPNSNKAVGIEEPDVSLDVSAEHVDQREVIDDCIDAELIALHTIVSHADEYKSTAIKDRPDIDLDTLLLMAVNFEKEDMVRVLLENGANVEAIQCDGQPALIIAAAKGFRSICGLLLEMNANIEVKDRVNEETGLMVAAVRGHAEVVELFLESGARVGVENCYGSTALDLAKRKKVWNTVHILEKEPRKWLKRV